MLQAQGWLGLNSGFKTTLVYIQNPYVKKKIADLAFETKQNNLKATKRFGVGVKKRKKIYLNHIQSPGLFLVAHTVFWFSLVSLPDPLCQPNPLNPLKFILPAISRPSLSHISNLVNLPGPGLPVPSQSPDYPSSHTCLHQPNLVSPACTLPKPKTWPQGYA